MSIRQSTDTRRQGEMQMVPATGGALVAYLIFLLSFGFTAAVVLGIIP
ncbi:hypothetical protein L598_002500000080 [Mesorhizobium sp. J18]|nr:hypothetical protein [Mesorhizobium sp. J18]TWG96700.1 hypothetical protein L598_002500000080 [Mesorhizobium sp. J18]